MLLIFINELAQILSTFGIVVKMFADDVKLYLKSVKNVDFSSLQAAMNALCKWANLWQLSISVEKCCVLCVGKVDPIVNIFLSGTALPCVTSCRDLGVTVSSDLAFSTHEKNIVAKAHQRANAIHRCFISKNTNLLVRAYLTYVRPLLEYNSIIWSSHYKCDVDAIEKVQRRFTKRIPSFNNYSYGERLNLLHLPRLETRRMQNDLIWCYKILFGHVKICSSNFFEFQLSSTREPPYKLFKKQCTNTTKSVFFAKRVINIWNSLPSDLVDFSSLKSFTCSIKTVYLSDYCTGSI